MRLQLASDGSFETLPSIKWLDEPEDHDYDAAFDVLTLITDEAHANRIVRTLEYSDTVERAAKDILRMSGEPLLPKSNAHVAKNLRKLEKDEPLSPVLLVAGRGLGRLIIADGYHRVSAVYHHDEDQPIRCRLAHPA